MNELPRPDSFLLRVLRVVRPRQGPRLRWGWARGSGGVREQARLLAHRSDPAPSPPLPSPLHTPCPQRGLDGLGEHGGGWEVESRPQTADVGSPGDREVLREPPVAAGGSRGVHAVGLTPRRNGCACRQASSGQGQSRGDAGVVSRELGP